MKQGDRLRAAADLMDRVVFPPRQKVGRNSERVAVACAVAHKAKVSALGYCPVKKAGRECWCCAYKLKLRRKM